MGIFLMTLLACMVGLGVGLPLATLWDLALMRDLILPPAWRVGMATMALRAVGGAFMGFCLGVAQAWALRHIYPSLPRRRWVGATAAASTAFTCQRMLWLAETAPVASNAC